MDRLHVQAQELTAIQATLKIQFKRTAAMQAELDLLPHAQRRRKVLRSLLTERSGHNGDHRNHS